MIEYEFEDLVLEFSPDGSYTKGYLVVIANEADVTFGETIDVTSSKARNTFVRDARELYPEAFSDEIMLKRALNELSVHVTDQERAALAEMEKEEDEVDPEIRVDDGAAEALISEPNVLNRYVEAMAEVHEVYGDRPQMKALALAALSAQLKPLSDGIPAGTNAALMGESGRGKNYLADAIRQGLPYSFVYEFESASAKSLYYEADADPDKFRHTWLYPNEAEGTDNLIEVLRPLLSKGSASHKTVDTGEEGSSTARNLHVEGPVTLTIPTVRNKLDGQLQTRLLVIELEDFENRVAEHSAKVSDTMLLSYAAKDHTSTLALWKAALEKLTEVRRVGITSRPDDFRFRSNKVAHGARLWRNFLSLMLTNAWLEQRNREVIELENGERAVVVDAEDYRVAYEVFAGACVRSGVNISENHRKILNAVYQLQQAEKRPRFAARATLTGR